MSYYDGSASITTNSAFTTAFTPLKQPGIYKTQQLELWKDYYERSAFGHINVNPKDYADTCLKDYLQKAKELKIYVEE